MTMSKELARSRGRSCGEAMAADTTFDRQAADRFAWVETTYPSLAGMDLESMVTAFTTERLNSRPDLQRLPELGAVVDAVLAEREGFRETCPDPLRESFHYDFFFFVSHRLQTRYVARTLPPSQCTNFIFRDSAEGGVIQGNNRDDILRPYLGKEPVFPDRGPGAFTVPCVRKIGQVSAALLCDDEPDCLFPVDAEALIPDTITDVREYVGYLERYADFWGPGNRLYVGSDWTVAAVEKANVRMGVRYNDGWGAITACCYLTPEMRAFKESCDQKYYAAAGLDRTGCKERLFWDASIQSYDRLLELTEAENARGATLLGAAGICLDHAVPHGVCHDGRTFHPDEPDGNYTLSTDVTCHGGENARGLHWRLDTMQDDPPPIWTTKPRILPGEGNALRPEWQAELDAAGELGA